MKKIKKFIDAILTNIDIWYKIPFDNILVLNWKYICYGGQVSELSV